MNRDHNALYLIITNVPIRRLKVCIPVLIYASPFGIEQVWVHWSIKVSRARFIKERRYFKSTYWLFIIIFSVERL